MTDVLLLEYSPVNQVVFRFSEPSLHKDFYENWVRNFPNFKVERKVVRTLQRLETKIFEFQNDVERKRERILILVIDSHGSYEHGGFFIDTNESYSLYKRIEVEIENGCIDKVKKFIPDQITQPINLKKREVESDGKEEERKGIPKKKEEEEEEEGEIEEENVEELSYREKMKRDLVLCDKSFFWPGFTMNEIVFGDSFLEKVKRAKPHAVAKAFFNNIYDHLAHENFRYTYKMLIRDDKIFFPHVFDPIWESTVHDFQLDTTNKKDNESMSQVYASIRQRIKDKFMFAPNYSMSPAEFYDGNEILSFCGIKRLFENMSGFSGMYCIFGQCHGDLFKEKLEEVFRTKNNSETPFISFSLGSFDPEARRGQKIEYFKKVGYHLNNSHRGIYTCVGNVLRMEVEKKKYLRSKLNRFIDKIIEV